jgi:hypothetical protein
MEVDAAQERARKQTLTTLAGRVALDNLTNLLAACAWQQHGPADSDSLERISKFNLIITANLIRTNLNKSEQARAITVHDGMEGEPETGTGGNLAYPYRKILGSTTQWKSNGRATEAQILFRRRNG